MASTVQRILTDSTKLLASGLIAKGFGFITQFVVARILGPAEFGLLKTIAYIPSLTKFGSFGFDGVAKRELPPTLASGDSDRAQMIRNNAFSADLVWSVVLSATVVGVSFTFDNETVRYGLWVSAATLILAQLSRLFTVTLSVDRRFGKVAVGGALIAFLTTLLTLVLLFPFRVIGVLLATLLATLVTILWYRRQTTLRFRFRFDRTELRRQIRIAVPLAGATLAFGLLGWAERLQTVHLFGEEMRGIYLFAVYLIQMVSLLVSNVLRAGAIDIYENLGESPDLESASRMLRQLTSLISLLMPAVLSGLMLSALYLVPAFLPAYLPVLDLLPWMVAAVFLESFASFYITSMNSAHFNLQFRLMMTTLVAVGLFVGVTWLGFSVGIGLVAAGMGKLAYSSIRVVVALISTGRPLSSIRSDFGRYHAGILLPALGVLISSSYVFAGIRQDSTEYLIILLPLALISLIVGARAKRPEFNGTNLFGFVAEMAPAVFSWKSNHPKNR